MTVRLSATPTMVPAPTNAVAPTTDRTEHDDGGAASATKPVRILAICDDVDPRLYGPGIVERRGQVDLILSCGDLPPYYIDYVGSMLQAPIYGVHGNHDGEFVRRDDEGRADWGMEELHGRVVHEQGLL